MPPKRKAAATKEPPKPRRSKLARENDLSAEAEAEIKEAWGLCREDGVDGYEDEKEGVIPTSKVDIVMRALGVAPRSASDLAEFQSILDPENEGHVSYPHFVELCAIQINSRSDETKAEEVERAHKLFTRNQDRPILIHDLRQVARMLKEDVSDDVLKAMILEANGGVGVHSGVNVEQFQEVMTRAGVFH